MDQKWICLILAHTEYHWATELIMPKEHMLYLELMSEINKESFLNWMCWPTIWVTVTKSVRTPCWPLQTLSWGVTPPIHQRLVSLGNWKPLRARVVTGSYKQWHAGQKVSVYTPVTHTHRPLRPPSLHLALVWWTQCSLFLCWNYKACLYLVHSIIYFVFKVVTNKCMLN